MPYGVSRQLSLGRASGGEEEQMLNKIFTSYLEAAGEAKAYYRAGDFRKTHAAILLKRQSLFLCLYLLKRDFEFPAVG
jgi:hypothetical protein